MSRKIKRFEEELKTKSWFRQIMIVVVNDLEIWFQTKQDYIRQRIRGQKSSDEFYNHFKTSNANENSNMLEQLEQIFKRSNIFTKRVNILTQFGRKFSKRSLIEIRQLNPGIRVFDSLYRVFDSMSLTEQRNWKKQIKWSRKWYTEFYKPTFQ